MVEAQHNDVGHDRGGEERLRGPVPHGRLDAQAPGAARGGRARRGGAGPGQGHDLGVGQAALARGRRGGLRVRVAVVRVEREVQVQDADEQVLADHPRDRGHEEPAPRHLQGGGGQECIGRGGGTPPAPLSGCPVYAQPLCP